MVVPSASLSADSPYIGCAGIPLHHHMASNWNDAARTMNYNSDVLYERNRLIGYLVMRLPEKAMPQSYQNTIAAKLLK